MKLIIFDLDGVITTEATYWDIARRGLQQILKTNGDVLPLDFIYWAKNHAINHNWDVAFVALAARGNFRQLHGHLTGRALLEACPGYRGARWQEVHDVCQTIQDASPLPNAALHSAEECVALMTTLERMGYELAVATGRPRPEAVAPLNALGIRHYFPENRIITHLEVQQGEQTACVPLGKPHPFVALKAIYPALSTEQLLRLPKEARPGVYFIGDTASDVGAALAAGVQPIGILTALPEGHYREQRRQTLAALGCQVILDSVLQLPTCVP